MRAESHFREGNCKRVTLDTTAPLERAIRLYERFGLAPSEKIEDFFGMPLAEQSAMPLYSRVRRRHSGIHRHGRTYKEQQKHPSSSRFWTGCPCVALLPLRLMLVGASSMVNVPAVQTPAVDRS